MSQYMADGVSTLSEGIETGDRNAGSFGHRVAVSCPEAGR
jgi:hypothetical protein